VVKANDGREIQIAGGLHTKNASQVMKYTLEE